MIYKIKYNDPDYMIISTNNSVKEVNLAIEKVIDSSCPSEELLKELGAILIYDSANEDIAEFEM